MGEQIVRFPFTFGGRLSISAAKPHLPQRPDPCAIFERHSA